MLQPVLYTPMLLGCGVYGQIIACGAHVQKRVSFEWEQHLERANRLLATSSATAEQRNFVKRALAKRGRDANGARPFKSGDVHAQYAQFENDETVLDANTDEVGALRLLQGHPNIVELHEFDARTCVITLERCDGDITMLMERHYEFYVSDMARLLSAMHHLRDRDVVHCDIKPENVLFCRAPSGRMIYKLCDFGLAERSGVSVLAQYKYTEGYRCWELLVCRDGESYVVLKFEHDWWALAITMLEMMIYHKRGRLYLLLMPSQLGCIELQALIDRLLKDIRCPETRRVLRAMLRACPGERVLPGEDFRLPT